MSLLERIVNIFVSNYRDKRIHINLLSRCYSHSNVLAYLHSIALNYHLYR